MYQKESFLFLDRWCARVPRAHCTLTAPRRAFNWAFKVRGAWQDNAHAPGWRQRNSGLPVQKAEERHRRAPGPRTRCSARLPRLPFERPIPPFRREAAVTEGTFPPGIFT